MRMKICASCGRVEVGAFARLTGKVALPLASDSGRFSIGVRSFDAVSVIGDAKLVAGETRTSAPGPTSMSPSSCRPEAGAP